MRHSAPFFSFILLMTFFLAPEIRAQDNEVGLVQQIKEQKKKVGSTDRAQIWRVGTGGGPVHESDPLLLDDIVELNQQVLLDLGLFREHLDSRVVMGTRNLARSGAYLIRQDTSRISDLELVIRKGVMVVKHSSGQLTAIAAKIRTSIFGTTVLFQIEEDEDEGVVYVQEGTIGFPNWPGLERLETRGDARAWKVQSGQRPVELIISDDLRKRFEDEILYNTVSAWRKTPFWRKPTFFIPAAAGLLGVGYLFRPESSGGQATGRVVVTIPN